MKIKLDEDIPHSVRDALQALGHAVDTVEDEQLIGEDDAIVWRAAQADGRFFVTQDLRYADVRDYPPGKHHGLLLVRKVIGREALSAAVVDVFATRDAATLAGAHAVTNGVRTRVQHAP